MTIIKRQGHKFSELWMIDSVGRNDRPTGENLYRFIWEPTKLKGKVDVFRKPCVTKNQVYDVLSEIEKRAIDGKYPLIHFETHGDPKGLSLKYGEFIEWEELAKPIQRINVASGVNLMLVIAACYGIEAMWVAGLVGFNQAPFYALIGPKYRIYDKELEEGFKAFYRELLDTLSINDALVAANNELDTIPNNIKVLAIEDLWSFAVKNAKYTGKENKERKEVLLTQIMDNPEVAILGINKARRLLNKHNNYSDLSRVVKREYFCVEQFPENEDRFF